VKIIISAVPQPLLALTTAHR